MEVLKKWRNRVKNEKEIDRLREVIDDLLVQLTETRYAYLENLRTLRFSQKANERHKRANRRLRGMLDDVGWPKNDRQPERIVPRKIKLP